ncbi:MAG: thioredoxin [Spirochaetaceae bacterium]|nr:MAG: thioredoxin [Spirochaetaceae bacterium]
MEVTITTSNFADEVEKSPVPVLLDFWAEWCMPCKMIAPVLEEIAGEYEGKLKIGKVNVDQEGDLAGRFNIVSIPTLLLVKNGEVVKEHVGAAPRPTIEALFSDQI